MSDEVHSRHDEAPQRAAQGAPHQEPHFDSPSRSTQATAGRRAGGSSNGSVMPLPAAATRGGVAAVAGRGAGSGGLFGPSSSQQQHQQHQRGVDAAASLSPSSMVSTASSLVCSSCEMMQCACYVSTLPCSFSPFLSYAGTPTLSRGHGVRRPLRSATQQLLPSATTVCSCCGRVSTLTRFLVPSCRCFCCPAHNCHTAPPCSGCHCSARACTAVCHSGDWRPSARWPSSAPGGKGTHAGPL
jgi:hypothetical protein